METPMKMNIPQRLIATLALSAALFASGSIGFVNVAEAGKNERRGRMAGKMKELGLTEDQKKKVQEIRKKGREQSKQLREQTKAARAQLKEAVQKDTSKEELTRLFQNVQQKQQAMAAHRFNQAMEIREVLTPEQRKKAGEMMGKFFEKGRKKGGPDADEDSDDE